MDDASMWQEIIKWVIGAGLVLTISITVAVKVVKNSNKVTQKSKGDNSPNTYIGS